MKQLVPEIDISFSISAADKELHRFLYDEASDRVFLAATNSLYVRTSSLQAITKVSVGPRNDSLVCPPNPNEDCDCPSANISVECTRTAMDSTIKAMVVDRQNDILIVCTDRYYGYCSKVFLRNYRLDERFYTPVVSNSLVGEAIMLLPGDDHVFVAASRDINNGLTLFKDKSYMISKRKLEDFSLSVFDTSTGIRSFLNVRSEFRDQFPVEFVYGFTHEEHSFFIGVRPESETESHPRTFISRLCNSDQTCRSYVELELRCEGFGRLISATYAGVGSILANSLSIETDGKLIYALFTYAASGSIDIDPRANRTAVCIFSMAEVMANMETAIKLCYQGGSSVGPPYIVNDKRCIRREVSAIMVSVHLPSQQRLNVIWSECMS